MLHMDDYYRWELSMAVMGMNFASVFCDGATDVAIKAQEIMFVRDGTNLKKGKEQQDIMMHRNFKIDYFEKARQGTLDTLLAALSDRLRDLNDPIVKASGLGDLSRWPDDYTQGADKMKSDDLVCNIYFNGTKPCGGGILALDGLTGNTLWEHRSVHEIFSLNCQEDLDQDGVKDCIGGGRAGIFQAASGHDGSLLWRFNDSSQNTRMNAYTGQYIGDMDNDGVLDILNIHGGDPLGEPGSATRLVGQLMLFSGRTGAVLHWFSVPDKRESYYSPVLYRRRDGTDYVLFGTGGETHSGSLWLITLKDLQRGNIKKAIRLYQDAYKGIMTPPLLVDINHDGTEDIVFAAFNSTIVALDGETYGILWTFSYNSSETYATPAAGFYNDDDVPDFLIRWQTGPGFPIYYYSIMTVLDGVTGLPLITPYPRDSIGAQASPLTVSAEGTGNDVFLYWISDCHGQKGRGGAFSFVKGTNVHEQSRADFCRLRFKSAGFSKMLAISGWIPAPGQTVYNSEERYHVEHSVWVNTTALAQDFLRTHPEQMQDFKEWEAWVAEQQNKWKTKDKLRKSDGKDSGQTEASSYRDQTLPRDGGETRRRQGEYSKDQDADLRQKITSIVSELLGNADRLDETEDYDRSKDVGADLDVGGSRQGVSKRLEGGDEFRDRDGAGADESTRRADHGYGLRGMGSVQIGSRNRGDGLYPDRQTGGVSSHGEWLRGMNAARDSSRRGWEGVLHPDEISQVPRRGWLPQSQDVSPRDSWQDQFIGPDNTGSSPLRNWQARLHGMGKGSATHQGWQVQPHDVSLQDWKGRRTMNAPKQNGWAKDQLRRAGTANAARGTWGQSRLQDTETVGGRSQQKKTGRGVEEAEAKVRLQALHKKYMDSFGRKKRRKNKGHEGRPKRHVGPHDEGGLQRLISTGTLAPPLLAPADPDYARSMDIVFATYWFYPAKTTILLPEDEACVKQKMDGETIRFDPNSDYYGMDHDAYEHAVLDQCLEQSGHVPETGTYESQSTFNPYTLHMGQMTVYRLHLKCQCTDEAVLQSRGERCAGFLPHEKQQWASYMGSHGDSHWAPRPASSKHRGTSGSDKGR